MKKSFFARLEAESYVLADDLMLAQHRLFLEWDHLELDEFLRDGATFRRRRFGLFYFNPGTDELLPMQHETYFQRQSINTYAGGISRSFAPLSPAAIGNEYLNALIRMLLRQLPIEPDRLAHPWQVDVHQIRITASITQLGEPTPEGPHHDGEEFVAIHLVQRRNVTGGINRVYSNDQESVFSCTLLEPMDTLICWDPHVMHDVSPIRPVDSDKLAVRDTLLIGYDPRPQLRRPAVDITTAPAR
jgi:hypothetical protein